MPASPKPLLLLLLVVASALAAVAQPLRSPEDEYAYRIKQRSINGRYIPGDLEEAMVELDKVTSESNKEAYAARPEDVVVHKLFFSFGRWIAINYSLYEGSRIGVFLRNLGVDTPDAQIELLMRAWHRHLNGAPLDVRDLVERYTDEKARRDSLRRVELGVAPARGSVDTAEN